MVQQNYFRYQTKFLYMSTKAFVSCMYMKSTKKHELRVDYKVLRAESRLLFFREDLSLSLSLPSRL